MLHRQILLNMALAAIAEAILMRTSAEQVPFLHRVAPWCLKPVTSNFGPNIFADVVRAVGQDLVLFCADFHSICRCFVYESVGEILKFTTAAAHGSMSSTSRRLHVGLPPMEMAVWWSWSVSCLICRNKLNRMGEKRHSWRYCSLEELP